MEGAGGEGGGACCGCPCCLLVEELRWETAREERKCKRAGTEMIVSHSFHGSFSLTSFSLNNAAFLFFKKKKKKITPVCVATLFTENSY